MARATVPRVRLGSFRRAEEPTRATGVLNAYYGELLLRLAGLGHDARAFPYDWRRDVETTAAELDYFLERTCPEHARLALVAHGLGGLVARALWLRRKDRPLPGWIILLGTPNCGTDLAARMLAGVDATFDAWHVLPRALSRRGTALAFPQARVSALWPRSDCWERSGPSPASTRCSQKPTRPRGTTTAAARGARHSGRLKLMVRATSRPRNANSTADGTSADGSQRPWTRAAWSMSWAEDFRHGS